MEKTILWKEEIDQIKKKLIWKGFKGKVEIAKIERVKENDFDLMFYCPPIVLQNYKTFEAAKLGAERKLSNWLKKAMLKDILEK